MNAFTQFFAAIRLDFKRWKNRRARAKRVVKNSPQPDNRSWSGAFMAGLKS